MDLLSTCREDRPLQNLSNEVFEDVRPPSPPPLEPLSSTWKPIHFSIHEKTRPFPPIPNPMVNAKKEIIDSTEQISSQFSDTILIHEAKAMSIRSLALLNSIKSWTRQNQNDPFGTIQEAIGLFETSGLRGHSIGAYNAAVLRDPEYTLSVSDEIKSLPGSASKLKAFKDPLVSIHFYKVAANAGHSVAQYRLGLKLLQRAFTDPTMKSDGLKWIQKSAENGHGPAQEYLNYTNPEPLSRLLTLSSLQKCSKKGDSKASFSMGCFYAFHGQYGEAIDAFVLAARQTQDSTLICDAYYNIGTLYGKLSNSEQSKSYFLKASKLGDFQAQSRLDFDHLLS